MDDFLYVLKLMLINDLTQAQVDQQMMIYENYINEQVAGGKTLEEVMYKLGDPAKIAELIIEKYRDGKTPNVEEEEYYEEPRMSFLDRLRRRGNMTAEEINAEIKNPERGVRAEFKENEGWDIRLGKFKLNSWYGTFAILGIILVIFILIHELTGLV